MKLKDVKERIDEYFEKISAEDLYKISVSKYGFTEILSEIESMNYQKISISDSYKENDYFFFPKRNNRRKNKGMCNLSLAA